MENRPKVLVTWHPDIFLHDLSVNHVAMDKNRIAGVAASVKNLEGIDGIRLELAQPATAEQFGRVHETEYLAQLAATAQLPEGELHEFDRETRLSRHTWRALELSAGGVCQAVDSVLTGHARHAFNIGYAGHHAQRRYASGFCFTNSIAIGVFHARARGIGRIAVLDFDTHSGNGTINAVVRYPEILFAETFQHGFPGRVLPGIPPTHIARVECNTAREFSDGWRLLLAKVRAFSPELIFVSAGFDGHHADPLGKPGLSDDHYGWIADEISALGVPIVATLEGGYSVPDTGRCASLFVERLAGVRTRSDIC